MSRFWSAPVKELRPYIPGLQIQNAEVIKLNTNESPLGPSPEALAAMQASANDMLRLYPDPTSRSLREALADFHALKPDQIHVGNGSDEVLAHIFLGLLKQADPVAFPDITYGFYPVYCDLFGMQHVRIPLATDFSLDLEAFDRTPGPVIFPNPNAPTGIAISCDEIAAMLDARPDRLIVVDEAYVDFGAETAVPLIGRFPNLIVVQTMSKSRGLAGLRIGYAMGHPELIDGLRRVKDSINPYPIGRIAEAGAVASLQDTDHFKNTVRHVMDGRTALSQKLRAMGFEVLPSRANFVFTRHEAFSGSELTKAMEERGILIRHFSGGRTENYARITVGTMGQIDRLCAALSEMIGSRRA